MNYMLLHVGGNIDPDEVKVPKAPYYWFDPITKTSWGEYNFDKVENTGGRSSLSYRPIFTSRAQGGQYKAHFIPAVFQPVPRNEDVAEIFTHGGLNLFYQGCNKREDKDVMWENISEEDPTPWIDVQDNPFTRSRK